MTTPEFRRRAYRMEQGKGGERGGSRVLISADDPALLRTSEYKANMQTFRKLVLQVEHWLDNSF